MTLIKEPELPLRALVGATFSRTFTVRNRSTGVAVDLTGWTPTMLVFATKGDTTPVWEFTPSNGLTLPTPANGQLLLNFFVDPSAALPTFNLALGEYWYRMRLQSGPTTVWALWPGTLTVAAQ